MPRHSAQILELARRGAEHRFRELKAEIASILKHFPYLREGFGGSFPVPLEGVRRRRPKMSSAARRAVSVRMKKYWATRRRSAKG